jgi:heme/copper-type cytochrome/quinol oxidase subunit 2
MFELVLPLAAINMMWYALPLIVVISLVYSATRHEAIGAILSHSMRLAVMITGFMAAIMACLAFLNWWV